MIILGKDHHIYFFLKENAKFQLSTEPYLTKSRSNGQSKFGFGSLASKTKTDYPITCRKANFEINLKKA